MLSIFPSTNFILASKSPRRQELLKHILPTFELRIKEIEEVYPVDLNPREVPQYLAELKAKGFQDELKQNDILISSDTIVYMNNKIYGKPKDREEGIAFLQELSGKRHEVITGVCLLSREGIHSFIETTYVYFKKLDQNEIEYYIDHYKPYDKAGAYAIQEWIGMIGIEKIEGDYFNVVGLPLSRLYDELQKIKSH
ncbi:MAG: septum formation protein Maf [Chitinophagales bacterium]|nr:septum formation protein Maf [Chitinophagales bacterium]